MCESKKANMCVCVCVRERQTATETERKREERDRKWCGMCAVTQVCVCVNMHVYKAWGTGSTHSALPTGHIGDRYTPCTSSSTPSASPGALNTLQNRQGMLVTQVS